MGIENIEFCEIINLILAKKFADADFKLKSIIENKDDISEKDYSYACYLRGSIHTKPEYKEKDEVLAKKMFISSIESNEPYWDAYCMYAGCVKDKNIALNYLNIALDKFPDEPEIYINLMHYCDEVKLHECIAKIKDRNIKSYDLYCFLIAILISKKIWEEAEYFLKEALKVFSEIIYNSYYKLLHTFVLVIQNKDIKKCKEIFLELITLDVSNKLMYAPYLGYVWCCVIDNDIEDALIYINKIPVTNVLSNFDYFPYRPMINMNEFYKNAFSCIEEKSVDKEMLLKVRALEALYLYSCEDDFEKVHYNKKNLLYLKRYYKKYCQNVDIGCAIYNMQKHFKQYYDAYQIYVNMLEDVLYPEERYIDKLDFLDECTLEEFEKIYNDVLLKLKCTFIIDENCFITGILDSLISHLWTSNRGDKYQKIVVIAEYMSDFHLGLSNYLWDSDIYVEDENIGISKCLFEIACSYAQLDNTNSRAEKIYLVLLKNGAPNCKVLNNLGVIYENRDEVEKAFEYYKKACELDSSDEVYRKNYKRVATKLKKYTKVVDELKLESSWILERLFKLYDISDDFGEFLCSYKDRATVLKVSPQKGNELFEKFIQSNYIFKLKDTGVSRFRINPQVIEYLKKEKERLENNKYYEEIGIRLNIDEIERVGYTKDVIKSLEFIKDNELKEVLRRDFKECAIAVVTNQYKSAIVMCGSIIEAILVYIVEMKNYTKYDVGALFNSQSKMKQIKEMDLNELLEVCRKEKIIDTKEYHLLNYVRFYRNIIHPACEVRKSYNVDSLTMNLVWNSLLAVVREILV